MRLKRIHDEVSELIARHVPEMVAVEESYVGLDARTALSVGQARGAALVACANHEVPCVEYPPATIKQAVCGYGRADKAQVQRMVRAILALDVEPTPHHAADALAVAICHALAVAAPRAGWSTRVIARLRGRPVALDADGLVLDVGGVGYRLHATESAVRKAEGQDEVVLETHLHVREDALQLFGFATADERLLFEQLLGVTGVGPKVALAIVSAYAPAELRRAIVTDDAGALPDDPGNRAQARPAGRHGAAREDRPRRAAVGRAAGGGCGRRSPRRARRSRRARVHGRRGRAAARKRRSRPPACRTRARGAEGGLMDERVTAAVLAPEEDELDGSLRPRRLDEFVGQERIKEQLTIVLEAAKGRGEALDHVLLAGPPGLGKTSLAHIIREEMGVDIRLVAGPALERKGDMAAILTGLERHDVLFIDEIHRLNRAIEEILYPALEDFRLDIIVGQGPAARTLTLDLPPFTLVGATTRTGLLTTPLRDRFGMTFRLDYYTPEELTQIVTRSARILGVETEPAAAEEIAKRARGTPRVANRILRRVRDVAEVRFDGVITVEVAHDALALLEVDDGGLERIDRELLRAIVVKFDGGPVGLSTLAVSLGEEPDTIEDVYEPYLLQLGLIQRTPRGRIVTGLGRERVGVPAATGSSDNQLF